MRKSLYFVFLQDAEGNAAAGAIDMYYQAQPPSDDDHPGAVVVRVDATEVER